MAEDTGPTWPTLAKWALAVLNAVFALVLSLTWAQVSRYAHKIEQTELEIKGRAHLVPAFAELERKVREMEINVTALSSSGMTSSDGRALREYVDSELRECCYRRRNEPDGDNPPRSGR